MNVGFRLHGTHAMQSILTYVPGVCLSQGSSRLHCAKMAEQIKMLFGVNTPRGPRNIMLDVGPDPTAGRKRGLVLNFGTPSYLRNGLS